MGKQSFQETIKLWQKKFDEKVIKNRLPNVVYLNEDGWKASILLRTMFAMVMQEKTNKKEIMIKFF